MRILTINPVTSRDLLERTERYLDGIRGRSVSVEVVAIEKGPLSIETFHDEALAVPGILDLAKTRAAGFDGVVVNCFADPGVHPLRELLDVPVVGPAEASMLIASTLGHRFAVVSVLANSGPWVELQARAMGIRDRLAGAIGIDLPVLELGADDSLTSRYIVRAARDLIESRGADVIVLGCTGMAALARNVETEIGVPVVEPLAAAFKMAEALVSLGLSPKKGGLYLSPNSEGAAG